MTRQVELRPTLKFIKLSYALSLLVALGIGVWMLTDENHPQWAPWLFVIPGVWLVLTVIRNVRRRLVKLTVLGDRLRYEEGMLSKSTRTIELVKVQDVRVDQTFGQRMVGVGDLSLETAGGSSRIVIQSIDGPQAAADHILELARGQRPQ